MKKKKMFEYGSFVKPIIAKNASINDFYIIPAL